MFLFLLLLLIILKMEMRWISMMLFFILLTMTAAQYSPYCPYCRVDKCVLVERNLHSCTECAVGVLVNVANFPFGDKKPLMFGVCQLCPDRCNRCELAYYEQAFASPYYVLQCTSCKQRLVWDLTRGICKECDANCKACHCVPKVYPRSTDTCYQTSCDVCDNGYKVQDGKCVSARQLQEAQYSSAQDQNQSVK